MLTVFLMEIEERVSAGVSILDLKGRLVLDDGEKLFLQKVDALIQRGQKSILVNFSDVSDLDSTGVGVLVWKYITLRRQSGSLKLLRLSPRARRILSTAKLLSVLDAFESEADAVESFR